MAEANQQGNEGGNEGGNETEGSRLRRQLEEALNENKSLKSEKRERAFKDAGFDPKEGVGQLLANQYDGEVTSDAIREYAQGFGLEPQNAGGNQGGEGEGEGGQGGENLSEGEQQRLSGEQRLSNANQNSLPPRATDIKDEIRAAEANGDWDKSNQLKAQQLEALRS